MTREEAKKRLEVWQICGECPEDKQCYDSHLHSICEYDAYCDEVSISEAVKVAIKALEQEPCEDCISRQQVIKNIKELFEMGDCYSDKYSIIGTINQMPSIQPKTDVLDKIRAEIHATAELHEDGNYYLRDEWIDEIFDDYKAESEE